MGRFLPAACAGAIAILLVSAHASSERLETARAERLSADFSMERSIAALRQKLESSGRLMLGGPGLLRWETLRPARSVLVINRGRGEIRYPDLGVVKRFDFSTDPVMRVLSEHLLALTGGDLARAAEFYRIEEMEGGDKRLLPSQPEVQEIFREIRLSLDDRGAVRSVELISKGGDSTRIRFSNVRFNPELPADAFAVGG